ncbi:MAG TPA: heat-inducible transcriptional repressor HrcA [Myxococcota bacterium]|nr:heat-inducible transcriptional repressor HrcA [Myxococcota bacterium]
MSGASDDRTVSAAAEPPLSERQAEVLRVVVSSWIGQAAPVASETIAQLVPTACSSATVRTILAELAELGLVTKPHASAGRFPTDGGLRHYVRHLLGPRRLGREEMRDVEARVRDDDPERRRRAASRVLSERTRQLGFVLATRLADVELRHVSLVRLSSTRVLAVLVTRDGTALRRVVNDEGRGDQAELDRMAATLSETLAGGTLGEARARLAAESRALRDHADRLRARALHLAFEALNAPGDEADLVIATRLAVLDQPELHDPERLRELFGAIEARERLIEVVDQVLGPIGVTVRLGAELDDPSLRHWALVAAPYGEAGGTGALGVIGPSRMDYARVIPLVGYLSELLTERPTP